MKALILGMGHVGQPLAQRLRGEGRQFVGTPVGQCPGQFRQY